MSQPHTIIGHTTGPAEIRFTPSGAAVANFTVAESDRTFDKQANEWKDGPTTFWRVAAWRDLAENVAETLTDKGIKVVVTGKVVNRPYEKDGQQRTSLEITADEVGPALSRATAVVNKKQSGQGGSGQPQQARQGGNSGGGWGAPQDNPGNGWGAPQGGNGGGWGGRQ